MNKTNNSPSATGLFIFYIRDNIHTVFEKEKLMLAEIAASTGILVIALGFFGVIIAIIIAILILSSRSNTRIEDSIERDNREKFEETLRSIGVEDDLFEWLISLADNGLWRKIVFVEGKSVWFKAKPFSDLYFELGWGRSYFNSETPRVRYILICNDAKDRFETVMVGTCFGDDNKLRGDLRVKDLYEVVYKKCVLPQIDSEA